MKAVLSLPDFTNKKEFLMVIKINHYLKFKFDWQSHVLSSKSTLGKKKTKDKHMWNNIYS